MLEMGTVINTDKNVFNHFYWDPKIDILTNTSKSSIFSNNTYFLLYQNKHQKVKFKFPWLLFADFGVHFYSYNWIPPWNSV